MTKLMTLIPNPHADRQIPRATHLEWEQQILSPVQGRVLAVILSMSDLVPGADGMLSDAQGLWS